MKILKEIDKNGLTVAELVQILNDNNISLETAKINISNCNMQTIQENEGHVIFDVQKCISLYEYMKDRDRDYDIYDTEYDVIVTVSSFDKRDEQKEDDYTRFMLELFKRVRFVSNKDDTLIVNWCKLIENNIDKFKEFTNKYWKNTYKDDEEEFIYQWIREIHMYLAGYVSESFYKKLYDFVITLDSVVCM